MHWIKIKKLIFLWSHYCHVRAWQSFLWALGRKGHVCLDHGILSQGRTTSYRTAPFSNPAHIYNFYIWIAILQIKAQTWHRWAMLETTQRYFCWFQEHKLLNWASYMAYIIMYGKGGIIWILVEKTALPNRLHRHYVWDPLCNFTSIYCNAY